MPYVQFVSAESDHATRVLEVTRLPFAGEVFRLGDSELVRASQRPDVNRMFDFVDGPQVQSVPGSVVWVVPAERGHKHVPFEVIRELPEHQLPGR